MLIFLLCNFHFLCLLMENEVTVVDSEHLHYLKYYIISFSLQMKIDSFSTFNVATSLVLYHCYLAQFAGSY